MTNNKIYKGEAGMEQKYTSKGTSINSEKLPRIYGAKIPAGHTVLDYGCGKYVDHLKAKAAENGWVWSGYDPFNYVTDDVEINDYVICSNVLNVIAEDEVVNEVIRTCVDLAREYAVFTVYEKEGDGVGRQTGKDQWQRNEKTSAYMKRIRDLGYEAKSRNNMIWVRKAVA